MLVSDTKSEWNPIVVEMAKQFHDEYEVQAVRFGWNSQTPVAWDDLPEANKRTMLFTVENVLMLQRVAFEKLNEKAMHRGMSEVERCARGLVITAHPTDVGNHEVVKQWWDALKFAVDFPDCVEEECPTNHLTEAWLPIGDSCDIGEHLAFKFCPDCGTRLAREEDA